MNLLNTQSIKTSYLAQEATTTIDLREAFIIARENYCMACEEFQEAGLLYRSPKHYNANRATANDTFDAASIAYNAASAAYELAYKLYMSSSI